MKKGWKFTGGMLFAFCACIAAADDATEERIARLQQMLEEQHWQMQAMQEELKALQGARGRNDTFDDEDALTLRAQFDF